MKATLVEPAWDYDTLVKAQLSESAALLDIGCGGGERLAIYAPLVHRAVGVDVDSEMVTLARERAAVHPNVTVVVGDHRLKTIGSRFDVVTVRHAPYDLRAIRSHLVPGGMLITQQVGERNMAGIKRVLGQSLAASPVSVDDFDAAGFVVTRFDEYDVDYVVHDIESLVFWLASLDLDHADIDGPRLLAEVSLLNQVLAGCVDSDGFHTNEHRYLAVATLPS